MHQTTQEVGISSSPTKAKVTINSLSHGETPVVAELKRKRYHLIRIELEGYQPYEATVTRKVSGWVWGNIVLGGLIGLAVDAISGGLYKLTPEQIAGELKQTNAAVSQVGDTVYLTVVLRPKAGWERIDSLKPIGE